MKKAYILFLAVCLVLSGCVQTSAASLPTDMPVNTPATLATATPVPPLSDTPTPSLSPEATLPPTPTQAVGEPVTILRIEMIDLANGWAVGETAPQALQRVLTTSDGGTTWQDVTPEEKISSPGADTSVLTAFSGLEQAWAIWFLPVPAPGSEALVVWHTTDRGQTWTPSEPLDTAGMTMDFFMPGELGFADPQVGWLLAHLGAGMNHDYVALYRTSDGGASWTRVVDPEQTGELPMSCAKTGVAFVDDQTGWLSGNCNGVLPGVFLYRSQDGGTSWAPVELPDPADQPGLLTSESGGCGSEAPVFTSAQAGILPVQCMLTDGSTQRWLYRTSDGGQTWTADPSPLPYGTLEFTPSGNVWMLGSSQSSGEQPRTLFVSPDGGQTWSQVLDAVAWNGQLDFVDDQNGWAVTLAGEGTRVLKSTDGGQTWSELNPQVILH